MSAQPTEVRDRVICGAREMFVAHGIHGISLNALCRHLHIAKKTFYVHFADKDALVAAVIATTLSDYATAVARASEHACERDRPREILRAVFSVSATHVSAQMLSDLQQSAPQLWRRIDRARKSLVTTLLQEFAQGQLDGRYRRDLDPTMLGATIHLVLERALDPHVLSERGLTPHVIASLLVDVFFDGIDA